LLALALGNFAMGVDTFVVAPLLGPMASDLGVSRVDAGWLITAFAVTYALAGPVLAGLLGHRRPRPILLAALLAFGVGNVLTAVAGTLALALVGRVVAAAGASMYTANALAAARGLVPAERQGRAAAVVVSGLTTAIVAGLPLGSELGHAVGWRVTLWLVVALAAAAAAAVAATLPDLPTRARASLGQRLAPLRQLRVLAILTSTLLCLTTSWTVYNFVDEVMAPAIGNSSSRLSVVLITFGVGAVGGNLLVGRLADRFGAVAVIRIVAPALTVVAASLPVLAGSMAVALPLATLWGFLHWMVNVPQQLRLVAVAPPAAPILLGLHQSTIYLGITAGSLVGSAGYHLDGRSGIAIGALVVGLCAVATILASTAEPSGLVGGSTVPRSADQRPSAHAGRR
jgi:predicted MFS family arabinose efflux permease